MNTTWLWLGYDQVLLHAILTLGHKYDYRVAPALVKQSCMIWAKKKLEICGFMGCKYYTHSCYFSQPKLQLEDRWKISLWLISVLRMHWRYCWLELNNRYDDHLKSLYTSRRFRASLIMFIFWYWRHSRSGNAPWGLVVVTRTREKWHLTLYSRRYSASRTRGMYIIYIYMYTCRYRG